MAAPRSAAPTPNIAPFITVGAVLLAAVAALLRLPGGVVAWAGSIVAAWMSSPPQLTGKKDAAGYPTVGNPGEGKKLRAHQTWLSLRWKLFGSADWLLNDPAPLRDQLKQAASPFAKMRAIALWLLVPQSLAAWVALGAAAVTFTLPIDGLAIIGASSDSATWLMWPNAVAVYVLVRQVDASRRRFAAPADPRPPIDVSRVITAAQDRRMQPLLVPVIALASATVGFAVTSTALVGFDVTWLIYPWQLAAAGAGVITASLVLRQIALPFALDEWHKTVDARQVWETRWTTLKLDPAPFLTRHAEYAGDDQLPVLADSFDAPANLGAEGVINLLPKMSPAIGGGYNVMALNEPDLDSSGQPVAGSKSPVKVTIVAWPTDTNVDVRDPSVDPQTLEILLRAAASHGLTVNTHLPQAMLTSLEKMTVDVEGRPAAWQAQWVCTDDPGTTLGWAAQQIEGMFGVEAIPDAAHGVIYVGALTDGEAEFTDAGVLPRLEQLDREVTWAQRWTNVLKQGEQKPYIQHEVYGQRKLATGQTLYTQPFMTPQGIMSEIYMNEVKEKSLSSTLENAPFVSVQRWDGIGERDGERHHGAFRVVWSSQPIAPTPARVVPTPGRGGRDATLWVLAAAVMSGFDAAKLPRPEVVSATPLTSRGSDLHIWDIQLRLYGAVTLATVKQQADKIRNGMGGVQWLRITTAQDGCRIVAGARPEDADFARREYQDLCTALDWEQAFTDAKVITPSGQVPKMVSAENLPKNQKVQRLVFRMPPGLDRQRVRDAKKTLMPATGNTYLEDEAGPTPDTVALVACPEQPVPFPAPFDWDEVAASAAVPFASGVTGEPIVYDWKLDPHLIVLGSTGSGKSASLQNLVTGGLIRGCHVFIADPTKAAADFQYAKPWAHAIAVTDGEASAMMDHVYAEVVRRKSLNAEYGVASYTDLPANVRPAHIMVVIDEFTSLMFTDKVEKLPANATEEEVHLHEEQELSNSNRRNIGGKSGRLVREARSAGVTLILAAQELRADTLSKIPGGASIKNNSSSLLLGKSTFGSRMSALKDAMAAPEIGDDVPKGRGLFESTAASAQVIQSWFDAPDHVGSMVEHIAAVREPLADADRIDLSAMVKSVDEGPVFGRRIDDSETGEADDGEDGDEIDLGLVDIDFAGMFDDDDDDDDDESPTTPSPGDASSNAIVFSGPGCDDDHAPQGAVDVDQLPPGDTVTGHPIVDTILGHLVRVPGVEQIEWVSPAAHESTADGIALIDVLASAAAMYGVEDVTAPWPTTTAAAADSEPPTVQPLPSPTVTDTETAPDPVQDPAVPAQLPSPPAAVVVPPPPAFDVSAAEDDMFGAPRRQLTDDERF